MSNEIKCHLWKSLKQKEKKLILERTKIDTEYYGKKVKPIIEDIKKRGDTALLEYCKQFDKLQTSASKLQVKESDFVEAEKNLSNEMKNALKNAYRNVSTYHQSILPRKSFPLKEVSSGVFIGEKFTPIDSVGLYIPSGKGTFPSMVYMLGIPAQLAEVPNIVLVSPPNASGKIDPACLYAAKLCGISNIYTIGGAHSIAALCFGTKTIPKVVKILGPGSAFVNAAKQYVKNYVDIGLPAGPSESIILADGTTSAELVAYDLCIEAEHGQDSMAILITHKKEYAEQVAKHLNKIIQKAPQSQSTVLQAGFNKFKGIIVTEDEEESISLTNEIATEHLMIHSESPTQYLSNIRNAGEILVGKNSPFSLANYAAGANAVLPTGGMAKSFSAVSVQDFIKRSSIIKITQKGFEELSPMVRTLANYEGFYFHEKALAIRTEKHKLSKD